MLAAGAAGAWWWTTREPGAATRSIAVLPFANLSGDPAQQYFADGMAEELRSALSRITRLKVIGRTSSETVRNAEARDAARKLGVANVITGSVRRSPTTLRVAAQLVDGSNGVELWSATFDRPVGDALAVQSEIAENVARALVVRVAPSELAALTAGGTTNAAAHDLFLKAQALAGSSDAEQAQRQGLAYLDAAIALDPNYADAHATRSLRLQEIAGNYARAPAEVRAGYEMAAQAARRAIALAPNIAAGYTALGNARHFQLRLAEALEQLERAYRLGRGDARMLRVYADVLGKMGRTGQALTILGEAEALDPLHPRLSATLAGVLFAARRYEESAAAARRTLQLAPMRTDARTWLVSSLILSGRMREAEAENSRFPEGSFRRLVLGSIIGARTRDTARSNSDLRQVEAQYGAVASYQLAQVHAQRGEREAAFRMLERAWRERDPGLVRLRADPFLDPLRSDSRLGELEKRLGYPA